MVRDFTEHPPSWLTGHRMDNLAQGLCASENGDRSVDPLPCFGPPLFYSGSGARLGLGHPSSVLLFLGIVFWEGSQSLADPWINSKHKETERGRVLSGSFAVATDDLLHGGDEHHMQCMEQVKETYKLGKFQFGQGKLTEKYFRQREDLSIEVNQETYVKDKLIHIELTRQRRRQRYSMCNEKDISLLRASVGALAWLAKETRPDLAGRVALLQQAFPKPRVLDLLEDNRSTQEAKGWQAAALF